jgi:hypothetical protein
MTGPAAGRSFVVMTNQRCHSNLLVPLAFSAAISLLLGHLVYLGVGLFGSGSVSTLSLIGAVAGVVGCALSIWVGFRRISAATRSV